MGGGKSLFSGYKVSVWDKEKILEVDGDDCTTTWMYSMPCIIHLKMINICYVYFTTIFFQKRVQDS